MVSVGKEIKKIREEKQALEKSLFETISTLEASPENKEWLKGALEVFAHGK
jgi:type I restriction enzyme M protein